jgi:hypothetical protein
VNLHHEKAGAFSDGQNFCEHFGHRFFSTRYLASPQKISRENLAGLISTSDMFVRKRFKMQILKFKKFKFKQIPVCLYVCPL